MNVKVKLVESPTIFLLKIDSDCLITESADISEENQLELKNLNPNAQGCCKSTQTNTAMQISEKEQTAPLIMNVGCSISCLYYYFVTAKICKLFFNAGPRLAGNCLGFVR